MALANVKVDNRVITVGSNTTSSSFSNLLDNTSGGQPFQAVITKSAGTDLLVSWSVTNLATSSPAAIGIGINDGTTDTVAYISNGFSSIGNRVAANGSIILSGLGAGTFTLTLRVKRAGGAGNAAWDGLAAGRAFISALELESGVNVKCKNVIQGATDFGTVTVGAWSDVKDADGGVSTAFTITKVSATSGILVRGTFGYYGNNSGSLNLLGVSDGTTDYQIATEETHSSSHNNIQGERLILVGASPGNYTLTLRFKLGAGAIVCVQNQAAHSLTAIEVEV